MKRTFFAMICVIGGSVFDRIAFNGCEPRYKTGITTVLGIG